jgi:hypothetical protein
MDKLVLERHLRWRGMHMSSNMEIIQIIKMLSRELPKEV